MIEVAGALGTVTRLARPARRVVSLVPSETETLTMVGARGQIVGRTCYCVEPAGEIEAVPEVGGTKDADVAAVLALRPDLVLLNQEENTEAIHRALVSAGVAVHLSFPKTVGDALGLCDDLARLVGVDPGGHPALVAAREAVAAAEQKRAKSLPRRVFCPIWMDPLMTIHGDTYISDVLDLAGGVNVFADRPRRYPLAADLGRAAPWSAARVGARDTRYPRVTVDELVARAPEVVLLPDEPHPFSEADAEFFRALDLPAARDNRVHRVGGRDLCWYSPRIAAGIARVAAWIEGVTLLKRASIR